MWKIFGKKCHLIKGTSRIIRHFEISYECVQYKKIHGLINLELSIYISICFVIVMYRLIKIATSQIKNLTTLNFIIKGILRNIYSSISL